MGAASDTLRVNIVQSITDQSRFNAALSSESNVVPAASVVTVSRVNLLKLLVLGTRRRRIQQMPDESH
jgi:hypothetical protein